MSKRETKERWERRMDAARMCGMSEESAAGFAQDRQDRDFNIEIFGEEEEA